MIHKLLKFYKYLATIMLTTCILLILLNVFFIFLAEIRWKHLNSFNPVYARYGDTLQKVYPNLNKTEIHNLLAETWGRVFEYQQFVQFGEGSYKGKYVNVDKNGFRLSKDQGPWPPDPSNYNVFIFGGSTTFGYGVSDEETIASYLQELLNFSSVEKHFKVYNFGRGNYYSTQERLLFESLLSKEFAINMAIFIDGMNERGDDKLQFTERLSKIMNREGLFLDFVRNTAGGRGFSTFAKLITDKLRDRSIPKTVKAGDGKSSSGDINSYIRKYDTYLVNKKIIESIGVKFGIETVFIWQPAPGYNYDLKHHIFAWGSRDLMGYQGRFYSCVRAIVDNNSMLGDNFLWCADILENEQKPLFVDSVHYTPYLAKKLAMEIAGFLSSKLDE